MSLALLNSFKIAGPISAPTAFGCRDIDALKLAFTPRCDPWGLDRISKFEKRRKFPERPWRAATMKASHETYPVILRGTALERRLVAVMPTRPLSTPFSGRCLQHLWRLARLALSTPARPRQLVCMHVGLTRSSALDALVPLV